MKKQSLKALIERLMEDGHLTAETVEGGRSTFYPYILRGDVELDYIEQRNGKKNYFWTDKQYPRIVEQFLDRG